MQITDLLPICERLQLRKLKYTTITLKKNIKLDMLVIGFSINQQNTDIKVHSLVPVPKTNTEEELESYIVNQIEEFKKTFEPHIDKALHIIDILSNEKKIHLSNEFRDSFYLNISDHSTSEVKLNKLKNAFTKIESKVKVLEKVTKEELKIKSIIDNLQITEYHTYFSLARRSPRKLKLYLGPTNSGKTYQALNDLTAHSSGLYLSPLRLLAWEGKEEIEKRGKLASLITGEEKVIVENAKFKAQTIETLNFLEYTDAVLIDEVQMLYDDARGWAWTQAVIGAPCRELIMAGAPESEPLVRRIAELLGEELEIIRVERFNPLEVATIPYSFPKDLPKMPEGTAMIAFSRKNVLKFKKYFESQNMPVSVIYGNLSPEVRKEEARKFRDGETKYIIATDSISMGLNMRISNIVFTSIEKYNGTKMSDLTPTEVKQISGRAGRFGKFEKGFVSALDMASLNHIQKNINKDSSVNKFLYIKPSIEHVYSISKALNTDKLFPILTFFTNKVMSSKIDDLYVCTSLSQEKSLAILLDKIPNISLEDKFIFSNSPLPGEEHQSIFLNWIRLYQEGKTIRVPSLKILNPRFFKFDNQLVLENYVKLLHLYSWLCYKKPKSFTDLDQCYVCREESNFKIETMLNNKTSNK